MNKQTRISQLAKLLDKTQDFSHSVKTLNRIDTEITDTEKEVYRKLSACKNDIPEYLVCDNNGSEMCAYYLSKGCDRICDYAKMKGILL